MQRKVVWLSHYHHSIFFILKDLIKFKQCKSKYLLNIFLEVRVLKLLINALTYVLNCNGVLL